MGINLAVVESPAFILVENRAGQQAGFDDQGVVVQSIPDSYAFIVNEDKVVVYPADRQATVRLKGTGSGVMNVRLIWVDSDQPTKAIFYEAIPVTSSTVATVNGSDSRFALNIDENGDGKNDQDFLPSITESQSESFLNSNNLILLAAAGLMLLGILLFILVIVGIFILGKLGLRVGSGNPAMNVEGDRSSRIKAGNNTDPKSTQSQHNVFCDIGTILNEVALILLSRFATL
jgi:hypothetical protein